LVDDIDGKTAQTETVAGIRISFYLADDGHKITTDESAVAQIYAATGVAWYYVIDTTNQRFKLPRTKHNVVGLRDAIGNYVSAGLPNITGHIISTERSDSGYGDIASGAFSAEQVWYWSFGGGSAGINDKRYKFDASDSDPTYGNSTTVQPPATQMYLYFYVGNFTQTALENTAGVTTETLNDKLDSDVGNATSTTKEAIVGWGLPDYNNPISIGTFNSSNPYTAPKAGFFYCAKASGLTLYVNGAESYYGGTAGSVQSAWGATVFVSKGDIITTDAGSTSRPTFYPLKGVA
jgi:hypothetical protein